MKKVLTGVLELAELIPPFKDRVDYNSEPSVEHNVPVYIHILDCKLLCSGQGCHSDAILRLSDVFAKEHENSWQSASASPKLPFFSQGYTKTRGGKGSM